MDLFVVVLRVLFVLAIFGVLFAAVLLPLIAFIHAVTTPGHVWRGAGRSKPVWLVALFFLSFFAAVPYWLWVRPALRDTRTRSAVAR